MFRRLAGGLFCGLCLVPLQLWAEVGWDDPQVWNRAKVLAPGQSRLSVRASHRNYTERFGDNGRMEPLGQKYDRAMTWRDLMRAEPSASDRLALERSMRQSGQDLDDVAATARFDVDRQETGLGLDWAFGLAQGWTLGVRVPVSYRTVRTRSRIDVTPPLARGLGTLKNQPVSNETYVRDLAQRSLDESGYDAFSDEESSWQFGDVSLLNRVALVDGYDWTWSLQNSIRFPTAPNTYTTDYFADSRDEGQVDLGLSSFLDRRFRRAIVGWRLGVVAQLPDSTRLRVGGSDIDSAVRRDLGDWAWSSLDADVNLSAGVGVLAEYGYMIKGRDVYKGYPYMSRRTEQELHVTRVGMRYQPAEGYRRSGVDRKWMAYAGYAHPWIGRNSADASRVSVEITAYY